MTRIGFFPIVGDPIHTGYLAAAKSAHKHLNLDTVYIQICGDSNYKPDKADKIHRHEMARIAILECEPMIKYTPIGYDSILLGEDLFIEFINNPPLSDIEEFYFITGYDNERVVRDAFSKNKRNLDNIPYNIAFLSNSISEINMNNGNCQVIYFSPFYSSTSFRNHERTDIVPMGVLNYCVKHHLYGY